MPDGEQKNRREIKIEKLLLTGPGESPEGATWGSQGRVQAKRVRTWAHAFIGVHVWNVKARWVKSNQKASGFGKLHRAQKGKALGGGGDY